MKTGASAPIWKTERRISREHFLPRSHQPGLWPGAVKKLHKQRLPGKKALIVISSGKSTRANGYLDTVQDQLTQAGGSVHGL